MSQTPLNLSALDNEQFEDLVEAIFRAKAAPSIYETSDPTENIQYAVTSVSRSGRGTDEGRDLLVTTLVRDCIAPRNVKWIVQCKHKAVSRKSVGAGDFINDFGFHEMLLRHDAIGYLLVCSTRPGTKLQNHFDKLTNDSLTHLYIAWDYAKVCEEVFRHESVMQQFFPEAYRYHKKLVGSDRIERWITEHGNAISDDAREALRGILTGSGQTEDEVSKR